MSDRRARLQRYLRFWGPNIDADIDDELRYHLDMRIADLIANGFTPDRAREEALRRFGDPVDVARTLRAHDTAKLRTTGRIDMLQDLMQDLQYGARKLALAPWFTLAVVVVLALGIGANAAVFSAVDAALLRPLPFAHADRLVAVYGPELPLNLGKGGPVFPKSSPAIEDVRADSDAFSGIAAYATGGLNLTGGAEPVRTTITYVTADFFSVLGRFPALGRSFAPEEMTSGEHKAVVISYPLWQQQFGGDAHVTGRSLKLNDVAYDVVGVMPRGFSFPSQTDVWIALPVPVDFSVLAAFRNFLPAKFVARLAPGMTPAGAAKHMDIMRRRFRSKLSPNDHPADRLVLPLQDELVGTSRKALLILMASAVLLLLIACANVTNLLLARATTRRREIAVRIALGATRFRIVRQLGVESMVLALMGGVVALAVARMSLGALRLAMPASLVAVSPPRIDVSLLIFTMTVALLTSFLVGISPAFGSSRVELTDAMKVGSAGSTGHHGRVGRSALVVAELALAMMLIVGAGLLVESLHRLLTVDTGMQTGQLVTARLTLPEARYKTALAKSTFINAITQRIATVPGVMSASAVSALPLEQSGGIGLRTFPEGAEHDTSRAAMAVYLSATPGYFRALGASLRGVDLPTTYDSLRKVVVINQTMAHRLWPDADAVGKRIVGVGGTHTVIGVVADIRTQSLDEKPVAQFYFPIAESGQQYVSLVVRGTVDTKTLIAAIRQSVRSVDPSQPLYAAQSMSDVVNASIAPRRTNTLLLTTFGALALVLAGIGVYAVLAYGVAQRRREIGVRMALGAQRGDVVRLVMRQGAVMATIGIAAGLAAAFALTRFLSSMLYGVGIHDWRVFVAAPIVLLLVALLATWLPARRATRVSPMEALSES